MPACIVGSPCFNEFHTPWKDMTQFSELKLIYREIHAKYHAGEDIRDAWRRFTEVAQQTSKFLGPLDAIRESIDACVDDQPKDTFRVLDHGCGGGMKIFYVAAIGYPNIYGVNVNEDVDWLNGVLRTVLDFDEDRFYRTDGKRLPFPENSMDMIISCQVLEHVSDADIENYYSEEARVLVDGGSAFHEVPHSFTPYDSHSRLWCAHWFPPFLRPLAFGVLKSIQQKKNLMPAGRIYAEQFCGWYVKLRSPIYHRKMLVKYFGSYRDFTRERLLAEHDWQDYDRDGSLMVRRLIDVLVKLPVLGLVFQPLFSNLMMLQTLATKKIV